MKALFINGSPRKNKNTAQMLESAMRGAQKAGAESRYGSHAAHWTERLLRPRRTHLCQLRHRRRNSLMADHAEPA